MLSAKFDAVLTCIKNGQPVFIRRRRNSSTKDKTCITWFWECYSRAPLQAPPGLSDRPDLALGDIFCNRVGGIDLPKLWIWTSDGDQHPHWNPIAEGDVRDDGRRLYITPKKKEPSWVKSDWCVKQMTKYQRGGEFLFSAPPLRQCSTRYIGSQT